MSIPTPTLQQATAYYESLKDSDQALLRRLWRGQGEEHAGWSALRLKQLGLVTGVDGSPVLTEKGWVLGDVLHGSKLERGGEVQ